MKPNKLKRNLIIIITVTILLVATIFVLYMTTDIFRTKRDAFFRYALQIPEIFDVLETSDEYQTFQKTKQNNTYTTTGEMRITSSENIADQSILNKVNMTVFGKTDYKRHGDAQRRWCRRIPRWRKNAGRGPGPHQCRPPASRCRCENTP